MACSEFIVNEPLSSIVPLIETRYHIENMATFKEERQKRKLAQLLAKEEEDLIRILSKKYNVEHLDLSTEPINTDALRLIPEEDARVAEVAAFHQVGKKISVAVRAPGTDKTKKVAADLKERGYIPTIYMVSRQSLERAWSRYKDISFAVETKAGVLDVSGEEIRKLLDEIKTVSDAKTHIEKVLKMKKAYRISRILETILAGALSSGASDVHIEPEESYVRLRYRLDGVLNDILTFDRDTYSLLTSRIKLLSGLKLNIKDAAQDGRFSVRIDQKDIEVRTSLLPGAYGEAIVMRILNPDTIQVSMEKLGLEPKLLKILEGEIRKPNGMLLTTGPTGSGKTTTLYAFLRKIRVPGIKIITIEDPIEYHLPGIVQTQVNRKKYTFANGLRSGLRQDPDVIMIGEIRDSEVASTAINAALTGHMVFSTLHTNNAAGSFPRLFDLGINPKIIGSAINATMAQRLIRQLCDACKKKVPLTGERKKVIDDTLKSVVDTSSIPENTKNIWEAVSCPECNNTGYRGRLGVFEAILMDKEIENLVQSNPSIREIKENARRQGILNMWQDGILKVLRGISSYEEIVRVLGTKESEIS